jgi:putative CocE/NonD family hydrolase
MSFGQQMQVGLFRPSSHGVLMERLGRVSYPGLLHPGSLLTGTSGGARLEMVPAHIGIPFDWLSDYEKFEAPDPADWTGRGYAVVNIDARGSWDSKGDMRSHSCISFTKDLSDKCDRWFGTGEGQDGYDAVEYIAKLPWCNGSVCMAGNSWLGVGQWITAAEQPPSLKCIAPFEGVSDIYREIICRGGVPYTAFFQWVASTLRGAIPFTLTINRVHTYVNRARQAGRPLFDAREVSFDERVLGG